MFVRDRREASNGRKTPKGGTETSLSSLHYKYLAVFWTMRAADWMQGPYFYEVYASKTYDDGTPFDSMTIAILFLCGFVSSGVCGSFVGVIVDRYGRRLGCIAFFVIYALSALTTTSNSLAVLVLGRILGGVATSLLESAPESWFVRQHELEDLPGELLGRCFGWAWFGNSIVAIIAGQLASTVAKNEDGSSDPTAPFLASTVLLMIGLVLVVAMWRENFGTREVSNEGTASQIQSTWSKIRADPRIMCVGAIQSLFEGSMYVFVLAWAPAIKVFAVDNEPVPFGTVFSSFMVCAMIGSSLFGELMKRSNVEMFMRYVLLVASGALMVASLGHSSFHLVVLGFLIFEGTVGVYFPSINCLRSTYIPNAIRSTAMNIFRVPLNAIVVTLNLSIKMIGTSGALATSAALLFLASLAQKRLQKL